MCDKLYNQKRMEAANQLKTIFDASLSECGLAEKLKAYEEFRFRFYLFSGKLILDENLEINQLKNHFLHFKIFGKSSEEFMNRQREDQDSEDSENSYLDDIQPIWDYHG